MPNPFARAAACCAVLALASTSALAQQPAADGLAVQVAPHAYVVTERGRNLVLIAGDRESLVAGQMAPALVAKARRALAALHARPVRWAAVMDGDSALAWEDGGWEASGATAVAHEALRHRMARARAPHEPSLGFSEVVQIAMEPDEEAHLVKQPDGTRNGDVSIHFEGAGVLYLSNFDSDGYPSIAADDGGTVSGLIRSLGDFAARFAGYPAAVEPIVPARGRLATLQDLRDCVAMLGTVRDRIGRLLDAGKTADDAVAAHPTADLDARWGHGPVTPDAFVRQAYAALAKERAATPVR